MHLLITSKSSSLLNELRGVKLSDSAKLRLIMHCQVLFSIAKADSNELVLSEIMFLVFFPEKRIRSKLHVFISELAVHCTFEKQGKIITHISDHPPGATPNPLADSPNPEQGPAAV